MRLPVIGAAILLSPLLISPFERVGALRKGKGGAAYRVCAPLLYNVSGVPPIVPQDAPPGTLGPGEMIPFSRGRLPSPSVIDLRICSRFRQSRSGTLALHGDTAEIMAATGAGAPPIPTQASARSDKWIIPQLKS